MKLRHGNGDEHGTRRQICKNQDVNDIVDAWNVVNRKGEVQNREQVSCLRLMEKWLLNGDKDV